VVAVIVGMEFTVAVTEVLVPVVHPLLVASTQYVVDKVILGVVNEVPVPKLTPPVEAAYQLMVPALAVAPSVTVPVPHLELGVVAVIVGMGLKVLVKGLVIL
jgi:hypothetical protein